MKTHLWVRRTLLTATALLATVVLTACGGDHGTNHTTPTSAPAGATFNSDDVQFAQAMIPHHQQAVVMATLAETRAADPELKALAARIKAAQDPEITTMTGWLTSWIQPTAHQGGHAMPGMMSDSDMAALGKATGTEFDRMFATLMIAHHNGAIEMARDEQAKGKDPAAKQLATMIEQTQAAEVATLQKILHRL